MLNNYTLCIMPRLRLGPENESLQNEAERSIFTSKFVFVLVTKSAQQKPKHSEFFKIIYFKTSFPHRYSTYRPRFDAAWKALCIACILLITLNNVGSTALFNAVFINPEQVVRFWLCSDYIFCLPIQ